MGCHPAKQVVIAFDAKTFDERRRTILESISLKPSPEPKFSSFKERKKSMSPSKLPKSMSKSKFNNNALKHNLSQQSLNKSTPKATRNIAESPFKLLFNKPIYKEDRIVMDLEAQFIKHENVFPVFVKAGEPTIISVTGDWIVEGFEEFTKNSKLEKFKPNSLLCRVGTGDYIKLESKNEIEFTESGPLFLVLKISEALMKPTGIIRMTFQNVELREECDLYDRTLNIEEFAHEREYYLASRLAEMREKPEHFNEIYVTRFTDVYPKSVESKLAIYEPKVSLKFNNGLTEVLENLMPVIGKNKEISDDIIDEQMKPFVSYYIGLKVFVGEYDEDIRTVNQLVVALAMDEKFVQFFMQDNVREYGFIEAKEKFGKIKFICLMVKEVSLK